MRQLFVLEWQKELFVKCSICRLKQSGRSKPLPYDEKEDFCDVVMPFSTASIAPCRVMFSKYL